MITNMLAELEGKSFVLADERELLQRAAAHPVIVRTDRAQSRTGSTTATSPVVGCPQVSRSVP